MGHPFKTLLVQQSKKQLIKTIEKKLLIPDYHKIRISEQGVV
jgi:hypothetical protein